MSEGPEFRFSTGIEVRWSDCDAFGHVNNAVYLTYLEQARLAYWQDVLAGIPFPGMIIARVEIDFTAQLFPGDQLELRAAVTHLGNTSFRLAYEVARTDGTVAARATSTQVFFDYATNRPTPMPQDIRDRVAAFEGLQA